MSEWRTGPAQRLATTKRRELEILNEYIERLDTLLLEARSFDGELRGKLQAINTRLHEVGSQIGVRSLQPQRWMSDDDIAEHAALEEQRADVEREWHAARAARTIRTTDGVKVSDSCELDVDDIGRKRRWVIRVRDATASELAEIERRFPADQYTEHRQRVESLRQRIG